MIKYHTKSIILLSTFLIFTACINNVLTEKIEGEAVIINNFKDRNVLKGIHIEVEYTNDEGYNYELLSSSITDENGYFKIDAEYKTGLISLDSWAIANVYSDGEHSEKLGNFSFQYLLDNKHSTINIDTFSLPHNIWVIPVIKDLGGYQPDEISIDFYNCEVVDTVQANMTFSNSITINQTLTPVEIKMTMNMQHWLSFGSRELARGSLKVNANEVGFGYFKLEDAKPTVEGDTLYLNFTVEED